MNPQQNNSQSINPQNNTMVVKTTPKDFFFHLGATIALYVAVGYLIQLLFAVVNYYFPDNLEGYFYSNPVAWAISSLIVLTPVLYVLECLIAKDVKAHPEKSEIWINRWRIYLNLFITGAIIIGDLITLINIYLNGEISERFLYKFIVILIVLGLIFSYYILERLGKSVKARNIISYSGIVLVFFSILLGFVTVGSPAKQRAIRFDNQRISDLQNIHGQIITYWQQKGRLPASLTEAQDPLYGNMIPVDPETSASYEYSVIKNTLEPNMHTFEICAVFSLEMQDVKGRGGYGGYTTPYYDRIGYDINDNWKHKAGRVCFNKTIDPERYPIIKLGL